MRLYSCRSRQFYIRSTELPYASFTKHTNVQDKPTWYGDLLRYRRCGALLVSDSDSDRVGPWTKGYLRTATDGSGQVGNREGLLSCLTSAER